MRLVLHGLFVSLNLIPSILLAQVGERDVIDRFEKYHLDYPVEKVYLHTSREVMTLGDTLYFSAFVLNGQDHTPNIESGLLHIELISPTNKILRSSNLKIDSLGRSFGDFAFSDTLSAGIYTIKAYTQYQLNFDEDFLFTRVIKLLPRMERQKEVEENISKDPEVTLTFFPEGGNLISETTNFLAFKFTDQFGNPMNISGEIVDQKGVKVSDLVSQHDGMGVIELFMEEGKEYTSQYEYANKTYSIPLPEVLPAGYQLHAEAGTDGWQVNVKTLNSSLDNTFLVVQSRGRLLKLLNSKSGLDSISFTMSHNEFPNGIIQITFFDGDHKAVAERLIYNENPDDQTVLKISTDQASYAKRSNVNIDYSLTQTNGEIPSLSTVSTTIIPKKLWVNPKQTITSCLLLTSDLKGYIHDPSYYTNPENPHRLPHIDLLMMTHGWRRFGWERVIQEETPEINYFTEHGITVEGRVIGYKNRKKTMVSDLYLTFPEDPKKERLHTTSQENGLFLFDGLDFEDTLTVSIKTLSDKEKQRQAGEVNSKTFIQILNRKIPVFKGHYFLPDYFSTDEEELIERGEQLFDIASAFDGQTIILDEIKVESRSPQKVDHFSNRPGLIYGKPTSRLVLDSIPGTLMTVFQYLGRVSGVRIAGTPPNQYAIIQGVNTLNTSPDRVSPLFLLNGIPIDLATVNNLSTKSIYFIDVLKGPDAAMYGTRGTNGVVAIYSRVAGDERIIPPQDPMGQIALSLAGYTAPRQFYMPDYSSPTENEKVRPDFRSTIYWNPMLLVEEGMASDHFYTSDESGEFIIYSEGITLSGEVFTSKVVYTVD
ncbi:MAG: TonB-dependent receptor plug domain-containing protein [Bacteroidota bacterium]